MFFFVYIGTRVNVIDNSGAIFGKCIELYCASKKRGAKIGTVVLLALRCVVPNKKVKKGDLAKGVVVRLCRRISRLGSFLKLTDNAVVLLHNLSLMPRAKRCKTPMFEEIRFGFLNGLKVISLAPIII